MKKEIKVITYCELGKFETEVSAALSDKFELVNTTTEMLSETIYYTAFLVRRVKGKDDNKTLAY